MACVIDDIGYCNRVGKCGDEWDRDKTVINDGSNEEYLLLWVQILVDTIDRELTSAFFMLLMVGTV